MIPVFSNLFFYKVATLPPLPDVVFNMFPSFKKPMLLFASPNFSSINKGKDF